MSPFESPATPDKKQSGFAEKIAGYQEELVEVEASLAAIEPVLKVKAGMASASVVFENLRVPEDREAALNNVQVKLRDLGASLDTLLGSGYEELLARQRELRQLIEQVRIDASE